MLELFSELVGPMIIAFVLGSALAFLVVTVVFRPAPTTGEPATPATPPQEP
jgi:hypothetical protein